MASLDTADVTIDFGQGLEQKADSKRIPLGALTRADNVMFTKDKQLRRRYGLTELAYTTATTNENMRLVLGEGEPAVFLDERNYCREGVAYSQQTNPALTPTLELQNKTINVDHLGTTTSTPSIQCASAVNGDYRLVMFRQSSTAYFTVLSTRTNQEIVSRTAFTSVSTSANIKILVYNSLFYVFYITGSATAVRTITTSGTVSSATTISGSSSQLFDVIVDNAGTGFYFVNHNSGVPRNRVTHQTFATPGTPTWTTDFTTTASIGALCFARVLGTRSELVVYYFSTSVGAIYYSRYTLLGVNSANGTYASITFTTALNIAAVINVATSDHYVALGGRVQADSVTRLADLRTRVYTNLASYTTGTLTHTIPGLLLTSPAVSGTDRKTFALTRNGVFVSVTCLTVPVTGYAERPRTVARAFIDTPLQSNGVDYGFSAQTDPEVSGTQYRFTTGRVVQPYNIGAPSTSECIYNIALVTMDTVDPSNRAPVAVLQNKTYVPGSAIATDTGFSGFLEPPRLTSVNSTGAAVVSTYVVLRSLDERPYYSPLSNALPITVTTGIVNVTLPPLGEQNAALELYVTEDNGSVYYLAESVIVTPSTYTQSITISVAVTSAAQQLYAQGGALENIPPAAPRWICTARNRLWCPSPENNMDLFHSSQPITGEDVRWHPDLVVRVPAQGGEITAVIEHNQRVLVFKENAVYAVSGDGPGLTGTGATFQVDQLSTSYGCESPNGAQLIPDGVLFKTENNGFWLINNKYEIQYIGRGVDDYKATLVKASVHVPDLKQVRFLLEDISEVFSYVLVYDYYYNVWTRFTYRCAALFADMCVSGDGRLYYLLNTPTPAVVYEDAASYVDVALLTEGDDDVTFDPSVITGWLNFAEVDGFQRVRYIDFQGTSAATGVCSVTIEFYYDYNTVTGAETHTFTIENGNEAEENKLFRRVFPIKQKARAMRVGIYITGNEFAESNLTAMTFRLGVKKKAAPADEDRRS